MNNKSAHLSEKLFEKNIEKVATRTGYGQGLVEAGRKDERVVALCADLAESTRTNLFQEEFPDRYIEVGVAEQALVTVASGMANYGKIPFVSSYASFSPGRNWEQIRTTIALNDVPVKVIGAHAGVSVGPDGATHQMLEDIALMRSMPNMTVIVPCDAIEARKATLAAAANNKPTYLRLTRNDTAVMTTEDTPFEVGKAEVFWEEKDPQVVIVACGPLVYEALKAARALAKSKIASVVINNHTVKPLDERTLIKYAKLAGAIVTVEEHQVNGGMGSAVAELLAKNFPVPMEFIGMQDSFGESGEPDELLKKFGMSAADIVEATKQVISRKTII